MDRALHAARSSTPARSGWDPPLHGKSRTLAKTKQETLQLQEKRSRTSNKLKKEECGAEQSGVGPLPSLSGEPGPHACLSVCLWNTPSQKAQGGSLERQVFLDFPGQGARGERVGRGLEEPRDSSSLCCCPPM